jgi:hypothetical protein
MGMMVRRCCYFALNTTGMGKTPDYELDCTLLHIRAYVHNMH